MPESTYIAYFIDSRKCAENSTNSYKILSVSMVFHHIAMLPLALNQFDVPPCCALVISFDIAASSSHLQNDRMTGLIGMCVCFVSTLDTVG